MNKILVLSLCFLSLLVGCGVGDIGSSSDSDSTTTTTDNSTTTGISECSIECEPTDGGFIFQQVCEGSVVNGPDFSLIKPEPCVEDEEEVIFDEEIPEAEEDEPEFII